MASQRIQGENEFIQWLSYLTREEKSQEAQHLIRSIAVLSVPIMRKYNLRVGLVSEFFPTSQGLHGLNQNSGQRIFLRLRSAEDRNVFLHVGEIMDTMLHELTHNDFGPHNERFHQRWNEYRAEYANTVAMKPGDSFLRDTSSEMKFRAINQTEERPSLMFAHTGRKLGGKPLDRNTSLRDAAGAAAMRRQSLNDQCGTHHRDATAIADRAVADGKQIRAPITDDDEFTQQALWDIYKAEAASKARAQGSSSRHPTTSSTTASGSQSKAQTSSRDQTSRETTSPSWICDFCMMTNTPDFPYCKVCGLERPDDFADLNPTDKGKQRAR